MSKIPWLCCIKVISSRHLNNINKDLKKENLFLQMSICELLFYLMIVLFSLLYLLDSYNFPFTLFDFYALFSFSSKHYSILLCFFVFVLLNDLNGIIQEKKYISMMVSIRYLYKKLCFFFNLWNVFLLFHVYFPIFLVCYFHFVFHVIKLLFYFIFFVQIFVCVLLVERNKAQKHK